MREFYPKDSAELILEKYDFKNIKHIQALEASNPGITYKAIQLWVNSYNEKVKSELVEIEKLYNSLDLQLKSGAENTKDPQTLARANQLYNNRLASLADAGWDPVTGKLMVEANSLVYPDTRVVKGSSIPGLPEELIIQILALGKISYVTAGHQPVGDGMIHRTGLAFDHFIQFLLTDTSFSPIEQEDFLRVRDDGFLQFKTKLRDGTTVVIERPGNAEELRSRELIKRYSSLTKESLEKMSAQSKKTFEDAKKRFEANQKLGMLANGWLIVGFVGKQNDKGETVPDYDNFILFQKQGRNMVYKTVDIWGITSPDVKLEYAKTDLTDMVEQAKKDKVSDLQKHGKEVLSLLGFERRVRGKNVMVLSGPALNSLNKALKNQEANQVLADYKNKFKSWLQTLLEKEKWVFIGGGTQGFEEQLNQIITEENVRRVVPFEMIGVVAGVTGGAEFDKNVKSFLPLQKAFYWDDYFTELLPLLTKTKLAKPNNLKFLFAGGGAIVQKQIRETLAEIDRSGIKSDVTLLPGLSMSMTDPKQMSATDLFLQSETGKAALETQKAVLITADTDAVGFLRSASKKVQGIDVLLQKPQNKGVGGFKCVDLF